jgi:hypothetical protein
MSPGRPREILEILLLNPLPRVLSSDRSPAACDETRGAWRVGTLPIPLNSCACACACACVLPSPVKLGPSISICAVCALCLGCLVITRAYARWLSRHPLRG